MHPRVDITGHRFGRLTAISRDGQRWVCECECGNRIIAKIGNLRSGNTKTCGCSRLGNRPRLTHGKSLSKVHRTWITARNRCTNPSNKDWPRYGGRGIVVCDRWLNSFEAFFADMGEPPTPQHSIDRIDNDGPYSPDNCRWATAREQNRNKRSTVLLTHNGETMCLRDWAARLNVSEWALYNRHRRGWSTADLLDTPILPDGGRRQG